MILGRPKLLKNARKLLGNLVKLPSLLLSLSVGVAVGLLFANLSARSYQYYIERNEKMQTHIAFMAYASACMTITKQCGFHSDDTDVMIGEACRHQARMFVDLNLQSIIQDIKENKDLDDQGN
jgi:hypothetical protein